jgi:peptidoglycan/LPS O-acetylase OafA/YrhL
MTVGTHAAVGKSATGAGYRLDIQGLRGVAVALVFFYHLGLPLPGGFLGVDIFFVISGFVITQLLVSHLEAHGSLNIPTFFFRRFLRLAPALAFVSVVTVICLNIFLTPSSTQVDAAKTSIGASLIGANVVIGQVSGGYFGNAPGSNALLHTWSLSVEEQFYLLFPLLLAVFWIANKGSAARKLFLVQVAIWSGATLSFALAFVPTFFELDWGQFIFGYYSPFTRAWEFAVGSGTFLFMRTRLLSPRVGLGVGVLGVLLIVLAVTIVSETNQTPGLSTLLPTLGTCLVLAAGSSRDSMLFRALSAKPIATVGDYSYSIYLWHWPILFMAAAIWPGNILALIAGGGLSIAAAVFSYRCIEKPFRRYRSAITTKALLSCGAIIVVPILISLTFLNNQDRYWAWLDETGLMQVAHPGDIGFRTFSNTFERETFECTGEWVASSDLTLEEGPPLNCRQSLPSGILKIAIIGDSHGTALFYGLKEAWPNENIVSYTVVWEGTEDQASEKSLAENAQILSIITGDSGIDDVIVTGYWAERPYPTSEWDLLVDQLTSAGIRTHFTDDVPAFEFTPDNCKYGASWVSMKSTVCHQQTSETPAQERELQQRFVNWAKGNKNVSLLETRRFFCQQKSCSMVSETGELLYRDDDHLNLNGSRYLGAKLTQAYPALQG